MTISTSSPAYEAYRSAREERPARAMAWNFYGRGIGRFGRDGRPEPVEVPAPRPDQLLVRVDAVGLCFSDVKLIRQGADHPKLYGRDLEREPTRLGHEVSVTVMTAGEALRDRFHPGQRLAIQPDIYVDGRSAAYGYTVPGGLVEYHTIGPEVLAADDGAYVVDIDHRLGYAEAALTEPWACVEAAYTQRRRLWPSPGGRMLIVGQPDDARDYDLDNVLVAGEVELLGVNASVLRQVDRSAALASEVPHASGTYDDIVMLAPNSAAHVAAFADMLAFRGVLNLMADAPLDGDVEIDIGRLHYHYTAYVGATGKRVAAAYGEARNRVEIRPGGVTVVVGAAGPMGQMHAERALGLPDGPRLVLALDLDGERLAVARERLAPVAAATGRALVVERIGSEPGSLEAVVRQHAGASGADDVIVTAPSADAVVAASRAMAPDGMLVLFAGVPVGTRAELDLSRVFLHAAQFTGTSGSRIADQAHVVERTLAGQLHPRRALAAVAGMEAARDSVEALMDGRFAGKIVVFPALRDLPLTPIAQLGKLHPDVGAALDPDGSWTTEAEARLFSHHLRRVAGQ